MLSLGIDLGSSSVKVTVLDIGSGKAVASAQYPEKELKINAPHPGWAEQDPETWWTCFQKAYEKVREKAEVDTKKIVSVGISYQMHGLVLVDKNLEVIRPSIIWCDSRAVSIGNNAYKALGEEYCDEHLLNSPGNFTASKLKWVKENEPQAYERIHKVLLPGDYLAMKLSGECHTTASGLSEGIFWDFKAHDVATKLLDFYGIDASILSEPKPTFGIQSNVLSEVGKQLGFGSETVVSYRAGDQPNNAFSLNVLEPGEIAATAGTSGVIYAVTDQLVGDEKSRVNTFLHGNSSNTLRRNGILLCVNGTGILNSWLRSNMGDDNLGYEQMNTMATEIPVGSEGLICLPFGNGAERVLENQDIKASFINLDFNRHSKKHMYRAAQEGIVFALTYGFEILSDLGAHSSTIRACKANMFLSPLFREAFTNSVNTPLELYDTDGAEGAARGAAVGAGHYKSFKEAFAGLTLLSLTKPEEHLVIEYNKAYQNWKKALNNALKNQ